MSKHALETLLGSRVRFKLLKLFFRNPNNQFSDLDVARRAQENINEVRKELATLEQIGLIGKVKREALSKKKHK